MKRFKEVLTIGLIGVALVAVSPRGSFAASQADTSAAKVDDSSLKSLILANLKDSATLAPRDIDVTVARGIVMLTGTVRTAAERARAGELARVSGVTRVNNAIEVDPKIDQSKVDAAADKTKAGAAKVVDATVNVAEKTKEAVQKGVGKVEQGAAKAADKTSDAVGKIGDKLSDRSVTTRVKAGISGEKMLDNTAIDVDTSDHVVTLKGTVASIAARDRAAAIAAGIEGVTSVINEIVVKES